MFALTLLFALFQAPEAACPHQDRTMVKEPGAVGDPVTTPCGGFTIAIAGQSITVPSIECPTNATFRLDSVWECQDPGTLPDYYCVPDAFNSPFQIGSNPAPCEFHVPTTLEELMELKEKGFISCKPLEWVTKHDNSAKVFKCGTGSNQATTAGGPHLDLAGVLALAASAPANSEYVQLAGLPRTEARVASPAVQEVFAARVPMDFVLVQGTAETVWFDTPLLRDTLAEAELREVRDELDRFGEYRRESSFQGALSSGSRFRVDTVRLMEENGGVEQSLVVEHHWGSGTYYSYGVQGSAESHLWEGDLARWLQSRLVWFGPVLGMWLANPGFLELVDGLSFSAMVDLGDGRGEFSVDCSSWIPGAATMTWTVDLGNRAVLDLAVADPAGLPMRQLRFRNHELVGGMYRPRRIVDLYLTHGGEPQLAQIVELTHTMTIPPDQQGVFLEPLEAESGLWVWHQE